MTVKDASGSHRDPRAITGDGRWGRTVVRIRWRVLAAALALVVVGITWGAGVFGSLISGGFEDPGSESAKTARRVTAELGSQSPDLVVLYSSATATVDDPAFRNPVTTTLGALRHRTEVARVVSYYNTGAPVLVSRNRHATYVAITLRAPTDGGKRAAYQALRPALTVSHQPGVTTQAGGLVAFNSVADAMTKQDVSSGEMMAMPIVLVLLVFLFGGLAAASMPLLIGGLAVLGALTTTRLIAGVTDVSTFAVNSITVLSLGMAIDYSLLVVSRFREELAAGKDTPTAVAATMATAGRTVLVSGITICLSLASLLIFPQVFLRSMGLGGMAGVLMAMLGSLTVLPAMLAILGPRINALRVPMPRRRHTLHPVPIGDESGVWARLARSVMRRPVRYIILVAAVLTVLALPFGHARYGGADERVLPAGTEPRVAAERIATEFPGGASAPIQVLLHGASPAQVQDLTARIRALPAVTGAQPTAGRGDVTLVSVSYAGAPTGHQAYAAVHAIRALHTPAGVNVQVGGRPAADVDLLHSLGERLPWMAAIMAAVTLVLLFLAFGSVLLPIKAVLMNVASIGASFGVLIWIFQDGHLSGLLGFTATGFIEPSTPIFVLAVLFGLATDYEVFLLSRVREEWLATGDNTASVATGLQRTGKIITSAALLLIIVVAAFATGQVVFAKLIGVGMLTAITVDAALVRTLLVPATMRLLGRWNWWAPPVVTSLHRRYGIHETTRPTPAPPQPSPVP
jgi:trehalose monomycolate/heme transporter